jgi:hypothetical protein
MQIAKIPDSGDELPSNLLEWYQNTPDLTEDGGPTFWLVVADQFERRCIHSSIVTQKALATIDFRFDLKDLVE